MLSYAPVSGKLFEEMFEDYDLHYQTKRFFAHREA
jgi:hypothetical protein